MTKFDIAKKKVLKEVHLAASAPDGYGIGSNPKFKIDGERLKLLRRIWVPRQVDLTAFELSDDEGRQIFDLPTINTFCGNCGDRWPFNPFAQDLYFAPGKGQDEHFYLGYQCQQCKGQLIRFLVARDGLKLRLAGRSPLEIIPAPKVLPKTTSKYYGDAVIAHHAGQTLAGLFLLRVFIEQFWRTVPEVKAVVAQKPRATGDEQGDAYQSTLPIDFKARFPSLKEIYGKLSEAIHSANPDAVLFDGSCAKIEEHFDARRIFKIPG